MLFTLGYEGLNLPGFLQILEANDVQTLIDVRQRPFSRKPGFSQAALRAATLVEGMRYSHMRALGCPQDVRDAFKDNEDWTQYTRDYKSYLQTQALLVQALARRAERERCCLVCFEADAQSCHRLFVAEAVREHNGLMVTHLTRNSTPTGALERLWAGR